MFTGLVEEIGIAEGVGRYREGLRLSVGRPPSFDDIKVGDSMAVNGACLTITDLDEHTITFDIIEESLERTNLKGLRKGDKVNLERAVKADQRLGGHFVTGHIDYEAQIKNVQVTSNTRRLEVNLPKEYRRYVIPKGSVTIDGVSLTVGEVFRDSFSVYLIPYTLKKTTLQLKNTRDIVNIELDMLAKYALQSKDEEKSSKINMSFLKEHGFA